MWGSIDGMQYFNKYGKIIWICLLFSLMARANAQTTHSDSLIHLINNSSGEEKVKTLIALTHELVDRNIDSSLNVSREALRLADSLRNPALAAKATYYIGFGYLQRKQMAEASKAFSKSLEYARDEKDHELHIKILLGQAEVCYERLQFDSARNILETAKALSIKHQLKTQLSAIYNNLSKISENQGKFTEAIEGYLKAAEPLKKQNDEAALAIVYYNIGLLYHKLNNYQEAMHYLNMAVEINKKENYLTALMENFNALGSIYSKTDLLEKAAYYYTLVIDAARRNNNEYNMAKGYLNLANLRKSQKNYKDAGKYYDSALYFCEKNNIEIGIIICKLNIGNYYNTIGDYASALKILREDQQLLAGYQLPDISATLYGFLSRAFKNAGVYDSALHYYELFNTINDSIAGQKTKDKVLSLEKKYESERNAREIAELQKNIIGEKSRSRSLIFISLFIVILFISISFLFYARRRAALLREQLAHQENKELKNIMELKNQELVCKALMVSNLNEQLDKINNHVKQIKPTLSPEAANKLDALLKDLEIKLPDQAWQEFEMRFEQVHQGFSDRLLAAYPELSPAELKVCSFLRLNMTTKDIALLSNRSIGTVDNIRSNIRKKLTLDTDDNLTSFLLNV